MHSCDHARIRVVDPRDAGKRREHKGGSRKEGGEGGAEEKARRKAHRRLTRIYGFVGLANKESAHETGFAGRHSPPRAQTESLVAVESTKTLDPSTFRISWPASTVSASGEFMAKLGFTSRWDTRTVGRGGRTSGALTEGKDRREEVRRREEEEGVASSGM